MSDIADLEISLHPQSVPAYRLEMQLRLPGRDDVVALRGGPSTASIDPKALAAQAYSPTTYGEALFESLFADRRAREFFTSARNNAAAQNQLLRVRLSISTDAPELHALRWETLRDPEDSSFLLQDRRIRFSRYLASDDWRDVRPQPRGALRALALIADPRPRPGESFAAIDVAAHPRLAQFAEASRNGRHNQDLFYHQPPVSLPVQSHPARPVRHMGGALQKRVELLVLPASVEQRRAQREANEARRKVLLKLAETQQGHAERWTAQLRKLGADVRPPSGARRRPSARFSPSTPVSCAPGPQGPRRQPRRPRH